MVRCSVVLLMLSALGCGAKSSPEASPPAATSQPATATKASAESPATPNVEAQLQGRWRTVSQMANGKEILKPNADPIICEYRGGKEILTQGDKQLSVADYSIDASTTPISFDTVSISENGQPDKLLGIIELNGDEVRICATSGKERPTEFVSTRPFVLITMKRLPPE